MQLLRWGPTFYSAIRRTFSLPQRAALTPSPAPALRERGELVSGLGIVDRRRRRIATATRISPLPLPVAERKGARGKVRGIVIDVGESGHHPPPSSPALRERKGVGGKVRATRCARQH